MPNGREANTTHPSKAVTSIHLNVSFLAQTGDPAFLHRLCFFAAEFFRNFIADLGNVADFVKWLAERDFFERGGQRAAINPAPITAEIPRAILGINLRHSV